MSKIVIQARHAEHLISGAYKARAEVAKAVMRGDLPPVLGLSCVDCGEPAKAYDHRDYGRPLEVEAVCDSCNGARGAAIPCLDAAQKYLDAVIEHEADWKSRMDAPVLLPIAAVAACNSYREAVRLAWDLRTIRNQTRAALAERIGAFPSHVTDFFAADDLKGRRSLPAELINDFEWAVGNRAVTQYLAHKAGKTLV
ncbi:hypothetical protein [Cupriavidus taiwanensis]|uniref:hypothetical protein n=1 Tax=Cupriavidus taiwanensis TaxID=164546 RepID=UPI000E14A3D0|nr:hypothetical protein [Cupriavidus taiwanensis]SPA44632.1 hypothetical protein CBM2629_A150434 [Cupriavidus taiwanensis]